MVSAGCLCVAIKRRIESKASEAFCERPGARGGEFCEGGTRAGRVWLREEDKNPNNMMKNDLILLRPPGSHGGGLLFIAHRPAFIVVLVPWPNRTGLALNR